VYPHKYPDAEVTDKAIRCLNVGIDGRSLDEVLIGALLLDPILGRNFSFDELRPYTKLMDVFARAM